MKTWGCGFKLLHPGLDALVVTSIIFKTLRQAQQNRDEPISAVKSKFSSGQGKGAVCFLGPVPAEGACPTGWRPLAGSLATGSLNNSGQRSRVLRASV